MPRELIEAGFVGFADGPVPGEADDAPRQTPAPAAAAGAGGSSLEAAVEAAYQELMAARPDAARRRLSALRRGADGMDVTRGAMVWGRRSSAFVCAAVLAGDTKLACEAWLLSRDLGGGYPFLPEASDPCSSIAEEEPELRKIYAHVPEREIEAQADAVLAHLAALMCKVDLPLLYPEDGEVLLNRRGRAPGGLKG